MKTKITILIVIIIPTLLLTCAPDRLLDLNTSKVTLNTGINPAVSRAVKDDVTSFKLTVTAEGMTAVEQVFNGESISLELEAGSARTFTLQALDAKGNALLSGSSTVNLIAGETVNVVITMEVAEIPVLGVLVSPVTSSIPVGGTVQLSPVIAPVNATNQTLTWTSSNTNVATVDTDGLVTAVADGTATITVTTGDGEFTAASVVTVIMTYTVSFDSNGGTGVNAVNVIGGNTIAEPSAPTLSDNIFAGWYTDDVTFSIPWVFTSSTVVSDLTLYAKWDEVYNVNFTTIGGTTNGYAQDGDHGSIGMPLSIYFIGTTTGGSGYFEVYDVNASSDPGVSGSDPALQAYFKVCVFSGTFSMDSFMVYNPGGSDVSITVDGWAGASTHPPENGTSDISHTDSANAGSWTTINLSGFTDLQNITIDFVDNTDLYFNQFFVY